MFISGDKQIYVEIAEKYKKFIELGVCKFGEKLPSCREMAFELGINPNTVEKAYSELEKIGYVKIIAKKGAFVDKALNSDCDEQKLIEHARKELEAIKNSGLSKETTKKILEEVFN